MIRQTLTFPKPYLKYEFIQEINKLWQVFADDEVEQNAKTISLLSPSQEIVASMSEGADRNFNLTYSGLPIQIQTEPQNKAIMCCISGGKDSLGTVLYYRNLGYNIRLYTVKGINKGYPDEYKATIELAKQLNLPLVIDEIKLSGKKFFMEHPLKNQVIASMALAYCLENHIAPQVSFGDYYGHHNEANLFGINWTDNYGLWVHFNKYIKPFISSAEVFIPLEQEEQSLELLTENFNLVPYYQSCMMSLRYKGRLRQGNQEKYHIELLPNRCGSCRKCCLEYIYFCDKGKFAYNADYYKHCLEILKKKWSEFTKSDRKFKDLREVYIAYFGNTKSKYFEN